LQPSSYSVQINPQHLNSQENLKENHSMFLLMARGLVEQVISSATEVPLAIRVLFSRIHSVVAAKFPQQTRNIITGFYFLRFIGPALATPELFGLVESPPTTKSRRSLVLLSKVLQNLANQVDFTEPYLGHLNAFIKENTAGIAKFMDDLVVGECGLSVFSLFTLPPLHLHRMYLLLNRKSFFSISLVINR
jgi:hypothetical protein